MKMDLKHISYILLATILTVLKGISSLRVSVEKNPSTPIEVGNNQVQLRCTYVNEANDRDVYSIEWQRETTRGSGSFEGIASYSTPSGEGAGFTTTSSGRSFENRSTLTNPTEGSLTAVLTVNLVECEDDGNYRCQVPFRNTSGFQQASGELSLTTIAPAEAPYMVPIASKTAGIEEEESVTFTCTANVGKPQGNIRWWKNRSSSISNSPTELTAPAPTKPPVKPGVCEYNVTSTLMVNLTKEDNQAVIRCSVDQELLSSPSGFPQDKPNKETAAINVYYKVRVPEISKQPSANDYQVGQASLTLTCITDGNPNPATATDKTINKFTWYYKADNGNNDTMATNVTGVQAKDGILTLSNLQMEQAGIYICEVQNGFNGNIFKERREEQINIVKTTTTSTTTPSPTSPAVITPTPAPQGENKTEGLSGGAIAGIVIGCVVVIVLIIVLVVCLRKKKGGDDSIEEPSEKPKNNKLQSAMNGQDFKDKNSAFYQGIQFEKNYNKDLQYADLTFDNKPGSRKPIQIYDIDNNRNTDVDHAPYSQVMMPSV